MVPGAPVYTQTVWSVWRDDLAGVAQATLEKVVACAEMDINEMRDLL